MCEQRLCQALVGGVRSGYRVCGLPAVVEGIPDPPGLDRGEEVRCYCRTHQHRARMIRYLPLTPYPAQAGEERVTVPGYYYTEVYANGVERRVNPYGFNHARTAYNGVSTAGRVEVL